MLKHIKNYLFALILLIIALPLLEYCFVLAEPKPLYGEGPKPNIDFLPSLWDKGEYQEVKEANLAHNFGLRPWLIRLHNEIEFRLMSKMYRQGGLLGKENYLFDLEYVVEYTGESYLGEKAIEEKMNKLQAIKDSLAKRNILLLVVFAPSKAHYYAEFLPKGYDIKGEHTHYESMTSACKQRNIPYIDFNSYFLSLKPTTPYPLIPKTGIHWTYYGSALAMDSIFKRMEKEKGVEMADFDWSEMEVSDVPRGSDDDLMQLAGIFTTFKNPPLAYPKLKFIHKEGEKKLKTLTIGDSFLWNIFNSGANENMFGKAEMWLYFNEIKPPKNPPSLDQYDIRKEMETFDVIIIESTGCNLFRLGFGFIDKAYESYVNPKPSGIDRVVFEQKVAEYMIKIKNSPEWLYNVSLQAEKENVSLDTMIRRNAIYMVNQEQKTNP